MHRNHKSVPGACALRPTWISRGVPLLVSRQPIDSGQDVPEQSAARSISSALAHMWHSERFVHVIDCSQASNRDLLDLQITTLFLLDSEQRLLAINEPGTPLAPWFFLGRSADGHRWRVRHDVPA